MEEVQAGIREDFLGNASAGDPADVRFSRMILLTDRPGAADYYAWLLGSDPEPSGSVSARLAELSISIAPPLEGIPHGWVPIFATQSKSALLSRLGEDFNVTRESDGLSFITDRDGVVCGFEITSAAESASPGLATCDYCTTCAAATAERYARLLTSEVVPYENDVFNFHLLRSAGSETAGVVEFGGQAVPSAWVVYFDVPDIDAVSARATEAGARLRVPPSDTASNRYAILSDPFNHVFGLSTRFD